MKVIGFSYTKISGERPKASDKPGPMKLSIDFSEISKENLDSFEEFNDSDFDALKIIFKFSVNYTQDNKNPQIDIEGNILISIEKEKSKEILNSWKTKEVPDYLRDTLFNVIYKKCSLKSIQIEEDLNLPSHIPLPTASTSKKDTTSKES